MAAVAALAYCVTASSAQAQTQLPEDLLLGGFEALKTCKILCGEVAEKNRRNCFEVQLAAAPGSPEASMKSLLQCLGAVSSAEVACMRECFETLSRQ